MVTTCEDGVCRHTEASKSLEGKEGSGEGTVASGGYSLVQRCAGCGGGKHPDQGCWVVKNSTTLELWKVAGRSQSQGCAGEACRHSLG